MPTIKITVNNLKDLPRMSKARARKLKAIPDDEIDFSDIPLLTEENFFNEAELILPSTETKTKISIRVNATTLNALKTYADRKGVKYQK